MTRAALVALILASACPALAQQRPQVPLRQIVADENCSASALPATVASAVVVSFAVLHDDGGCVIAFFRDLDDDSGTPLEVISSRGNSWIYGRVPVRDFDRSPVAAVDLEGGVILVTLRYTADDSAIPILTASLEHIATIYGTFVRTWPNGLIQYDSHQAHFAARDVQISVFDPNAVKDRNIYRSEAEILAPLYFDWQTNTFAFAAGGSVQTMVTCEGLASIDAIRCRETPLQAWQSGRPDLNLTQLVRFAASQPRFR